MAGLPGTGLGGVFYILLVVWMLVRELFLMTTGRGTSLRRWRAIGFHSALAATIVAALWVEGLALQRWSASLAPTADGSAALALNGVAPALVASPFIILAVLIVLVRLAAWTSRLEMPAAPLSPREE